MYVVILDEAGDVVVHQNIPPRSKDFQGLIKA